MNARPCKAGMRTRPQKGAGGRSYERSSRTRQAPSSSNPAPDLTGIRLRGNGAQSKGLARGLGESNSGREVRGCIVDGILPRRFRSRPGRREKARSEPASGSCRSPEGHLEPVPGPRSFDARSRLTRDRGARVQRLPKRLGPVFEHSLVWLFVRIGLTKLQQRHERPGATW